MAGEPVVLALLYAVECEIIIRPEPPEPPGLSLHLTKRDLFDVLRASTSIPLMNDILRFKNRHLHVDAGLMCNQPSRHHATLRISAWPLSFGSDVRPQPSALFDNYTITIPSEEVAEKMFNEGLKDGERFALKYKSHK